MIYLLEPCCISFSLLNHFIGQQTHGILEVRVLYLYAKNKNKIMNLLNHTCIVYYTYMYYLL